MLRDILYAAPIQHDKKYITVDTKVHMLMPGWIPSIPGWHTDGVPRGLLNDPAGYGKPNLAAQLTESSPRFHTYIFGAESLPSFITEQVELDFDESANLYEQMNIQINKTSLKCIEHPLDQWLSWDWWNIHTANPAINRGWRLLIRVTESDVVKPRTSNYIRTQNQVYIPNNFGW